MLTPIQRSLSVFEAKVRIQRFERKKSLVRIATGKMYKSCQPRRLASRRPEESMVLLSISVVTPIVIVATIINATTMAP